MCEKIRVKTRATNGKVRDVGEFVLPYPKLMKVLGKPDKIAGSYKWCFFVTGTSETGLNLLEIVSAEEKPRRRIKKWTVRVGKESEKMFKYLEKLIGMKVTRR
jgi:hypothetical protein